MQAFEIDRKAYRIAFNFHEERLRKLFESGFCAAFWDDTAQAMQREYEKHSTPTCRELLLSATCVLEQMQESAKGGK